MQTLTHSGFYLAVFILVLGSLVWGLGQGRVLTRSVGKHVWLLFALVGVSALYTVFFPILHRGGGVAADLRDVSPENADTVLRLAMAPEAKILYWVESPGNADLEDLTTWSGMSVQGRNAGIATADGDGEIRMRFKGFQEGTTGIGYRVCGDGGGLSAPMRVGFDDEMFQTGSKSNICSSTILRSENIEANANILRSQIEIFQKQFVGQTSESIFNSSSTKTEFSSTDAGTDRYASVTGITELRSLTTTQIQSDISNLNQITIQSLLDSLSAKYFTFTSPQTLHFSLAEAYRRYTQKVLADFNTYMTNTANQYRQFMTSTNSIDAFNYWLGVVSSTDTYLNDTNKTYSSGELSQSATAEPIDYITCTSALDKFITIVNRINTYKSNVESDISSSNSTYAAALEEVRRAKIQINTFKSLIQTSILANAVSKSISYKASFNGMDPLMDNTNSDWTDISDYTVFSTTSDETSLNTISDPIPIKKKYYSINYMLRLHACQIVDNTIHDFLNTVRTATVKQPVLPDSVMVPYYVYSNILTDEVQQMTDYSNTLAERNSLFKNIYSLIPTLPTLRTDYTTENVNNLNGFSFSSIDNIQLPTGENYIERATATFGNGLFINRTGRSLNMFDSPSASTSWRTWSVGGTTNGVANPTSHALDIIFPTHVNIGVIGIAFGSPAWSSVTISYDPNYVSSNAPVQSTSNINTATSVVLNSVNVNSSIININTGGIYTKYVRIVFSTTSTTPITPEVMNLVFYGTYDNFMPLKTSITDITHSNLTSLIPSSTSIINSNLKSMFFPNIRYICVYDRYHMTDIYNNNVIRVNRDSNITNVVGNAYSASISDTVSIDTAIDEYFISNTTTGYSLQSLFDKYRTGGELQLSVMNAMQMPTNAIYKNPSLKHFIDFFMGNAILGGDTTNGILSATANLAQILPTGSSRIIRRFIDSVYDIVQSVPSRTSPVTYRSLNYVAYNLPSGSSIPYADFKSVGISFHYNGKYTLTDSTVYCPIVTFYIAYTSSTTYTQVQIILTANTTTRYITISIMDVVSGSASTTCMYNYAIGTTLTTGYHHIGISFNTNTNTSIVLSASPIVVVFDGITLSGTRITNTNPSNATDPTITLPSPSTFTRIDIGSDYIDGNRNTNKSNTLFQSSFGLSWIHIYSSLMDANTFECDVNYDMPITGVTYTPDTNASMLTTLNHTGGGTSLTIANQTKDTCMKYCSSSFDCRGFNHTVTNTCTLYNGGSLTSTGGTLSGYVKNITQTPTPVVAPTPTPTTPPYVVYFTSATTPTLSAGLSWSGTAPVSIAAGTTYTINITPNVYTKLAYILVGGGGGGGSFSASQNGGGGGGSGYYVKNFTSTDTSPTNAITNTTALSNNYSLTTLAATPTFVNNTRSGSVLTPYNVSTISSIKLTVGAGGVIDADGGNTRLLTSSDVLISESIGGRKGVDIACSTSNRFGGNGFNGGGAPAGNSNCNSTNQLGGLGDSTYGGTNGSSGRLTSYMSGAGGGSVDGISTGGTGRDATTTNSRSGGGGGGGVGYKTKSGGDSSNGDDTSSQYGYALPGTDWTGAGGGGGGRNSGSNIKAAAGGGSGYAVLIFYN